MEAGQKIQWIERKRKTVSKTKVEGGKSLDQSQIEIKCYTIKWHFKVMQKGQ